MKKLLFILILIQSINLFGQYSSILSFDGDDPLNNDFDSHYIDIWFGGRGMDIYGNDSTFTIERVDFNCGFVDKTKRISFTKEEINRIRCFIDSTEKIYTYLINNEIDDYSFQKSFGRYVGRDYNIEYEMYYDNGFCKFYTSGYGFDVIFKIYTNTNKLHRKYRKTKTVFDLYDKYLFDLNESIASYKPDSNEQLREKEIISKIK